MTDARARRGHVVDFSAVSAAALDNMETLRSHLPVIASSAKDVTNNIGAAGRTAHAQVEELIDELRSQFSVVIVTHSMQQAARVSQKTAFFHLGNLVEYGDTPTIFTNPKDPRTEAYITGRIG